MPTPLVDLTGQVIGQWLVLRRSGSAKCRNAKWLCRCDCGTERAVTGSRLRRGDSKSCGCAIRAGDVIKYGSAHDRVRIRRGAASSYACIDCGVPAREWSLRHDAQATHLGLNTNGSICRYSLDPEDYEPRCAKCHRAYDHLE